MQDIADKVGVSKALVSLVIRKAPGPSDETRARVFAAAEELGYRVNRTAALMTARRSHLIGVMTDIRNSFHAEIVEDIVEAADRAGYEVVLGAVTPTHGEPKVIDTLLDFRCEGVILLGPESTGARSPRWAPGAHRRRRPPGVASAWMSCAPRMRAESARWSTTSSGSGTDGSCTSRAGPGDRRRPSQGLSAGDAPERSGRGRRVIEGDFTENAGVTAAKVCSRPAGCRPRWCAPTTASRIGVLDALRRAGVDVPGAVSITGYDDSVLAQLGHIDLTSVSQAPREQANRAVEAVVERLDGGRTEPVSSVLVPRLVVRGTTAAPA